MAIVDRRGVSVDATDTAIAGSPNPGLAIKAPVRVATTANITLSGLQTIDGVSLAAGDRVLVKDQTDQTTNGLYNASTGSWTRTIDAASNSHFAKGMLVGVTSGTINAGYLFVLTTADQVVLGTSNIAFTNYIFLQNALTSLVLSSTDAGAGVGPSLDLYRDSATPAASDFLASVDFNGRDSAANKQLYARLVAQITDPTSTTEAAILLLQQCIAGTLTTILQSSASAISLFGSLAIVGALSGVTTISMNGAISGLTAPTAQRLTAGSGTYVPSANVKRIRVTLIAGGGGGGAQATNNGTAGNASTFGDWTANGGSGGPKGDASTVGGAGGSGGTDGTGTLVVRRSGQRGGASANGALAIAGDGGSSATLVGAGLRHVSGNQNSGTGSTGGGGSGGGTYGTAAGGGGGGGETVVFWMTAAQIGAGLAYTIGATANGGAAGTVAGGNGASGHATIEEFYW